MDTRRILNGRRTVTLLIACAVEMSVTSTISNAHTVDRDQESFGYRVQQVALDLKYPEVNDEIYSHPLMREMFAHPEPFLTDAQTFFFQHPDLAELQSRVAITALQCANIDEYLKLLDRLSSAAKGKVSEWVLFYSVVPGFESSTRLATGFRDKKIQGALKKVARSPNATPNLRDAIKHILDGTAANAISSEKWTPTLVCKGKR
jgi:hypothetical protein